MSDDLDEASYRLIETALDQLDYVVPTNANIYVASYVPYYHDEEIKPPKRYDFATHKLVQEPATTKKKPGKWVQVAGEKKKRLIRYAIAYDSNRLPQAEFSMADDDKHVSTIPRSWEASGEIKVLHLHTNPRLADLIYDDERELRACDFPWAREVSSLSDEMRRDLFERNLHEQNEMPQVPVDGRTWLKQVAQYCTYDSDGNYYNKWKAGKPGPKRIQTDKYLEILALNRQEFILTKGKLYMLVMADDLPGVAYSIELDEDRTAKRIVPHRMSSGLLWTLPSFQQNMERQFNIYIVAAQEGADQESKSARKGGYHLKDGDQASYEVVDPRKLVAAAIGDEQLGKLNIREDDEWTWFLQLVAHVFAEPYYVLNAADANANPWVKQYGGMERLREECAKVLEKAWKKAPDDGKPITRATRNRIRELMKNEHLVVMPQGFPSGKNTRYIGTDGHYSFDRDIENGFVYVMPNAEYLGGLAQKQFAADLYEDLAWLIPMMEIAAAIAAVAVGGFAMGARKFVIKQATKKAAKEVLREAIKSVEPALVALLTDVFLDIIAKPAIEAYGALADVDVSDTEQWIERWQDFLRGFFDGYIRLNVAGRVAKLQDILMPTEAKAVLIATKLYDLVQKFRVFLERIEGVLTDGAVAKVLFNVEKAAVHFLRGMASALGLLYYLPFEEVKPILELLSDDGKPPDPEEWAKEAHEFFASINSKLESAGNEAASLRDLLDINSTKPYAIIVAGALGYTSFLTTALKKGGKSSKKKKGVYAVIGGLAIAYLAYEGKLDEVTGVAVELVKDIPNMLPGKDKKAAKINGQLVGKLIGTFMVDDALFGEGSTLGKRLAKNKALKIGVKGSLGGSLVSSVLKVLFSRYVVLAEKIGEKVKFLHSDLKQFVADERAAKKGDLEKAGLGHLNEFHAKSDDVMSFREMVAILVHLRDLMLKDQAAFAESVVDGIDELRDDFAALNRLTTAGGYDLEKLADRQLRSAMIQMNAHAYKALDELLKGVDWLFAEVADDTSIMTILQELGVDVGDLAHAHEQIRHAIEPRMDGFKQKEEALREKNGEMKQIEGAPLQ
jgi:hypothetical protein